MILIYNLLGLDYSKTPQQHYELAKELSNLRHKDILIVWSGNWCITVE